MKTRFNMWYSRLILVCVLLSAAYVPAVRAEGGDNAYRNETFGFSAQLPDGWSAREQPDNDSVIIATVSDLSALDAGKPTLDVLFSLTFTTLRQLGIRTVDEFGDLLKRMAGKQDITLEKVQFGDASGLGYTAGSPTQGLAGRSAILWVSGRRIAVVRAISSAGAWLSGGRERVEAFFKSLTFFAPTGADEDSVGRMLWSLDAKDAPDLTDIAITSDGSTLYAADKTKGIWEVGANGVGGTFAKPANIGEFAGVVVLKSGARLVADPQNHTIWYMGAGKAEAEKLIGGKVGKEMGQFGPNSPRAFALGPRAVYVLDENPAGLRIQVFDTAGTFIKYYDLSRLQPAPIENPVLTVDGDGLTYIVSKNSGGIYVIDALGYVRSKKLGTLALTNIEPLSMAVDRFNNIFVATTNQGILHLDATGKLVGVIGNPYDESDAPKPNQIARPKAVVLTPGGGPLYIADAGSKYPRIVAFGLDNNTVLSLTAGTKSGGTLTYGQTVSGEITREAFNYEYTFEGKANDIVTITLKATGFDAYVDVIRTVRGNKTRIAFSDDAKDADLGPQDARIKALKLPADGTYTIRATRFGREAADGVGTFTLTLEQAKES